MSGNIPRDEFGPEKILEVYDPKTGMHGFVVIDNTARGPGKGGIRMTSSVDKLEVFRLARAMTWKCAMAELPFGGAKSGIIADAKHLTTEKKEQIVRAFSRALKTVCPIHYVSAPDISMGEEEMKWFAAENGSMKSCTGKPSDIGGLPHELGSTGFGVYHAVLVAVEHLGLDIKNMAFAVEGFGNVGWFAAKYLCEKGAKLAAVSDSKGCIAVKDGIDFKKLAGTKKETGSIVNYAEEGKTVEKLGNEKIVGVNADILITAAVPDLINDTNVDDITARLVVCGSNICMQPKHEQILHEKGILVVPDFVANAGGVISSYVEYIGGTEEDMWKMVEEKITANTKYMLKESKSKKIKPRDAAMGIAKKRVEEAMKNRK